MTGPTNCRIYQCLTTDESAPTVGSVTSEELYEDLVSATLSSFNFSKLMTYSGPTPIPSFEEFVTTHEAIIELLGGWGSRLAAIGLNNRFDGLINLGYLAISPDTAEVRRFVKWMKKTYPSFDRVYLKTFKSQAAAEQFVTSPDGADVVKDAAWSKRVWALVHFDALFNEEVDFSIRMNYTNTPSTKGSVIYNWARGITPTYQKYIFSGFLTLQRTVEEYVSSEDYKRNLFRFRGDMNAPPITTQFISGSSNETYRMNLTAPYGMGQGIHVGIEVPDEGVRPQSFYRERGPISLGPAESGEGLGTYVTVPFPTGQYYKNAFYDFVGPLLGMVMCMSMLYPVSRFTQSLA